VNLTPPNKSLSQPKTTESSTKNWFFGSLLPILIVLLGIGIIAAMGKSRPIRVDDDDGTPEARLAKLATVYASPVVPFDGNKYLDIDATGVVVPFRQVTLAAEVGGRVAFKSDACRIGKFVEAGELLFKLDATDYQLEVERLAALRDSEYAQQKELDQEVSNAQRSLELSEQDVELQEKELQRLEKLPAGFASATELDQARRMQLAASTQRLTIQNQLELLESRRTRILLGERLAATQLSQAKVNLNRTQITAPISGVIVSEMVEQSSYIQKGATLCLIHDTQQVEVSCNLRSDQLMLVLDHKQAMSPVDSTPRASAESYELPPTPVTVEYRVAGRDESVYRWQGKLSRYEGIGLTAQSRTVPIRITVDDPRRMQRSEQSTDNKTNSRSPPALLQGMFVDCKIHTSPHRPLILVPKLALRPGNQVWKFVDDPSIIASPKMDESNPTKKPADEKPKPTTATASKPTTLKINLEEWSAGTVRVISNLQTIRSIRWPDNAGDEYWVAVAHPELEFGSLTIVSPVANLIGDGTDKVRLQLSPPAEAMPEANRVKSGPNP